jgi:hypothetical protein
MWPFMESKKTCPTCSFIIFEECPVIFHVCIIYKTGRYINAICHKKNQIYILTKKLFLVISIGWWPTWKKDLGRNFQLAARVTLAIYAEWFLCATDKLKKNKSKRLHAPIQLNFLVLRLKCSCKFWEEARIIFTPSTSSKVNHLSVFSTKGVYRYLRNDDYVRILII